MNVSQSACKVYSIAFGVIYALAVRFNWAAFAYYPAINEFHLHALPGRSSGPAMFWYGWMVTASVGSALLAILVPRDAAERLAPAVSVWIPVAVVIAVLTYEKHWFW